MPDEWCFCVILRTMMSGLSREFSDVISPHWTQANRGLHTLPEYAWHNRLASVSLLIAQRT